MWIIEDSTTLKLRNSSNQKRKETTKWEPIFVTYVNKRLVFRIHKEFLQILKKKKNQKKTEQWLEHIFYKRGNMNGQ